MFLEFKMFPEEVADAVSDPDIYLFDFGVRRKLGLEESLCACECGHPYYSHHFRDGYCNALEVGCYCRELKYIEIKFELVFTAADLFEVVNSNHAEPDSLQWWQEFKEWSEKWQMMSI